MDAEVPKYVPPPPPKRLSRPKITLQIPQTTYAGPPSSASRYATPNKYHGWPPSTPASQKLPPHVNHEWYMSMTQASDFIMNTAKSGLSFGEKTALWIVNKLKHLSKKWFTHFFLMLCLFLYSVIGAAIFMTLEAPHEEKYDKKLDDIRGNFTQKIRSIALQNEIQLKNASFDHLSLMVSDLMSYEDDVKDCLSRLHDNNTTRSTWTFINAMYYSGTIFTTIAVDV